MKTITLKIFLVSIILFSCNQIREGKIERKHQPDIYNLAATDIAINNAIEKAKQTFHQFDSIFNNDKKKLNYYAIKQQFTTIIGGSEHIWIGQISLIDGNYKGIVGNKPLITKEIKFGDTITINNKEISDWMIIDQSTGKTKGGFTIRVIRDKMDTEEKKAFDSNNGFIFE